MNRHLFDLPYITSGRGYVNRWTHLSDLPFITSSRGYVNRGTHLSDLLFITSVGMSTALLIDFIFVMISFPFCCRHELYAVLPLFYPFCRCHIITILLHDQVVWQCFPAFLFFSFPRGGGGGFRLKPHIQLGTVKLSRWHHWLNFVKTNDAAPRAAKSAQQRSRLNWQLHQLWKSFELPWASVRS